MSYQKISVDLHIHSTCSDGTYSPQQIIEMASHLTAISITDHDTIAAYKNLKLQNECQIIPGIEITTYSPYEMHILGYFIKGIDNNIANDIHKINIKRSKDILVLSDTLYHKGRIALSISEIVKKYKHLTINHLYLESIQTNKDLSLEEFYYDTYYLSGRTIGISYSDAICLLKKHDAISSIAHPNRLAKVLGINDLSIYKLLERFRLSGVDGIECYHESMTISDIDKYVVFANKHSFIITGGSDFHGIKKPNVEIGKGRGNLNVPDGILERINKIEGNNNVK